jgi:hypothetical protein
MTKRPFVGEGYLNLHLRALGVNAKRFLRVSYRYTPLWAYFDAEQAKEVVAEPGLEVGLDIRPLNARRRGNGDAPSPDLLWMPINALLVRGFLKPRLYERLYEAIDDLARGEDRSRREAVGATPTSD